MTLEQSSVALLERAIDDKIRKAASRGGSEMATVTRVEPDGTTWVHVFGGADETPVGRMMSTASVGDVVSVTFSGLTCTGIGNYTAPSASQRSLEKVSTETANAIRGVMDGLLQVRQLVADKVTTRELTAEVARIMDAQVGSLVAQVIESEQLRAAYAQADLANVRAIEMDAAVARELAARSGWFEDLTVAGDGSITGKLTSVLVDGDTARFRNIYADALKLLGEDGLYHALNFQGMGNGKEAVYTAVEPEGTENPSEEGWYEMSGDAYVPTEDTSVVARKAYYSRSEVYSDLAARELWDEYGEALDEGLHGSHIIAESITADKIDVTSLAAAMLMSQFVQIGAVGGTHVEARGDRFSFFTGGSGYSSLPDGYDVDPQVPMPGEVAYIAVDPVTRESTFYMTRSVVVKDLHFGNWKWFEKRNSNMALKWVGGDMSGS